MEVGKGKDRESEPGEPQPDKGKGPPAHFTRGETAHNVRKAGWGHREITSKRMGWGAVGGLRVGTGVEQGGSRISSLGQKLGWTGTTRYPRATGVERAGHQAHLWVPVSIGHLKQIPRVPVGVFLHQ